MCGIIGYVGTEEAAPILIESLKRLEYRGYDSAGIAVMNGKGFELTKCRGSLEVLSEQLESSTPQGQLGIGHTRWATHGEPSHSNSHPHYDCHRRFMVVHNGIIENYLTLKQGLTKRGHSFRSGTDTEVIPHLMEEYYRGDLLEAVTRTTEELEGSFAFALLSREDPSLLLAVRQDCPLVLGKGEDGSYLSSDIPALLPYTRDFYLMEDGELALLSEDGIEIRELAGERISRSSFKVDWDQEMACKDGYDHFMLKEINEQPEALKRTIVGLWGEGEDLSPKLSSLLRDIERVVILACGTAYYSGLVGKKMLEELVGLPVEVQISSEFRYSKMHLDRRTLLICVSQSGETADTIAALRRAKEEGARTLGLVNVIGSTIAREVEEVLYLRVGPEIAVASTKAYLGMVMAFSLLALGWARNWKQIDEDRYQRLASSLRKVPGMAEELLQWLPEKIMELIPLLQEAPSIFFIGRQLDYAVALEGALKLKEISYLHAEAYAAGELKHGTLALVEERTPVIALCTQPGVKEKMISNIKEVSARRAPIILFTTFEDDSLEELTDHLLVLPALAGELAPMLLALPLQLLAYYTALKRGCNIDKPRNLAKSVTVE